MASGRMAFCATQQVIVSCVAVVVVVQFARHIAQIALTLTFFE